MVFVGDPASLVSAASHGDAEAWDTLVERFAGLVWAVARGYRLSPADAADVSQTTWLRLAEHLERIRDPDRVGAWLATTARNEAMRTLQRNRRHVSVDTLDLVEDRGADPDHRLLESERDSALWLAFESLPSPCKRLLRLLLADPPPSYADVSEVLGMPIGSIGPTRNRCLQRLRTKAEVRHEQPISADRRVS